MAAVQVEVAPAAVEMDATGCASNAAATAEDTLDMLLLATEGEWGPHDGCVGQGGRGGELAAAVDVLGARHRLLLAGAGGAAAGIATLQPVPRPPAQSFTQTHPP